MRKTPCLSTHKDGLAITGDGPVVRRWPMVPGIDLIGTVIDSSNPNFAAGDKVLLIGWGVGEVHWGGFAQKARLKGDWLVKAPAAVAAAHGLHVSRIDGSPLVYNQPTSACQTC